MAQDKIFYRKIIDLKYDEERKALILQPDFQRTFNWPVFKQSKLIETILLDRPINPVHLVEDANHVSEVIDGQQRLTSCFRYLENRFALSGLRVATAYNGKKYRELPEEAQMQILHYQLGIFPYYEENDPNIKYDTFERLNTGSTVLMAQELRNCVFHGPYNDLVKELASNIHTKEVFGLQSTRMKDCELVLAFFALQNKIIDNGFSKNSKFSLDDEMKNNVNLSELEIGHKRDSFYSFLNLVSEIITEKAFRKVNKRNARFNDGIYHAFCLAIPKFKTSEIMNSIEDVREAIDGVLHNHYLFQDTDDGTILNRLDQRAALLNKTITNSICK